jgi:histidinol-phosphate phosphatase family protein
MGRRGLAVFLDRDGVINADRTDFVKSWAEFDFLPSVLSALAVLSRTQYKIVVVTNQSGVGRGLLTETTLREMNLRMTDRVREAGGRIDAIYYCPHLPETGCSCRKPAPGMFIAAATDLALDLSRSWMIGDGYRDIAAASAAGVRSILLSTGHAESHVVSPAARCLYARNLWEAVCLIQAITRAT